MAQWPLPSRWLAFPATFISLVHKQLKAHNQLSHYQQIGLPQKCNIALMTSYVTLKLRHCKSHKYKRIEWVTASCEREPEEPESERACMNFSSGMDSLSSGNDCSATFSALNSLVIYVSKLVYF